MLRIPFLTAFIGAIVLIVAGCAGVSTQLPHIALPDIAAERAKQEVMVFAGREKHLDRLYRVAGTVLQANSDLCPKIRKDIGVKTHTLKSYPRALRKAAIRELNASATPRVIYVRPGSSGARAGIKPGDILLGPETDRGRKAVASFSKDFQKTLHLGEHDMVFLREGQMFKTTVTPQLTCGYKVRLSTSAVINAYADGRNITVTTGMMDFTKNEAELALIIGHELGHNTMGHIRKIVGNMILSIFNRRYTRPFESEADYVGLYYMVRAGYTPEGVEDFWRRLALVNPKSVARAKTHPTYPDRYLSIAATRAEIKEKQANGTPILPNFLPDYKARVPRTKKGQRRSDKMDVRVAPNAGEPVRKTAPTTAELLASDSDLPVEKVK